jgi:GNAT superfamily N-acetyltransferase
LSEQASFRSSRLDFVRVDASGAARLARGQLEGLRAGPGWPHADTRDGLAMVRDDAGVFFLVLHDGAVIGDCGTHGAPDAQGSVEIGFGLAAPFRGYGYGRELAQALADWVSDLPGVREVTAETLVENVASQRVLEAAGFVRASATEVRGDGAGPADEGLVVLYRRPVPAR